MELPKIMMRAKTDTALTAPLPSPSPAEIAAAVKRPNRLAVAERLLVAKRGARAEFMEALPAKLEAARENYGEARKLEAQRLELEEEIRTLRREVMPMRAVHIEAVREALHPYSAGAGERLLQAIDTLRAAHNDVVAVAAALAEQGDRETLAPALPYGLGELERAARRMMERGRP
ncbi:MAG: hypothetical protein ACFCUT_02395 [Kiloniellaceae bacterium]